MRLFEKLEDQKIYYAGKYLSVSRENLPFGEELQPEFLAVATQVLWRLFKKLKAILTDHSGQQLKNKWKVMF